MNSNFREKKNIRARRESGTGKSDAKNKTRRAIEYTPSCECAFLNGGEAWVTEPSSGRVFVVDALKRRAVDEINLGGHPHHLRLAAGRVYVAVGPDELVVLDARSRSILKRVKVGSGVHDVALDHPTR